jgi:hypothetical protein
LSLGDSAAAGLQAIGWGENHGYADRLFDLARSEFTQLRLVKLGCSGETSESLISGVGNPYPCSYPSGSQLDEATSFLQSHPGQIKFITIDIGANDALAPCWDPSTGVFELTCVEAQLPAMQADLAYIIADASTAGLHLRIGLKRKTWHFYNERRLHGERIVTSERLGHLPDMNLAAARKAAKTRYKDNRRGSLFAPLTTLPIRLRLWRASANPRRGGLPLRAASAASNRRRMVESLSVADAAALLSGRFDSHSFNRSGESNSSRPTAK